MKKNEEEFRTPHDNMGKSKDFEGLRIADADARRIKNTRVIEFLNDIDWA